MKRIILLALAILSLGGLASAQDEQPFEYPQAPDTISSLEGRTSYVVMRFWDNSDFKKLLSDTVKLNKAFRDYATIFRYAYVDTVKNANRNLIARVKDDPKGVVVLAQAARYALFDGGAGYWSDEAYIPFARAVLANKKVKPDVKQAFMTDVTMLNNSQIGSTAPGSSYVTRHGATHNLYDQKADNTLVLFFPPDCGDCSIIRLRLETNVALGNLVKAGRMKVIVIYTHEPTQEWKEDVSSYPYEWEIGTSTGAAKEWDLRALPTNYLLDSDKRIIARGLTVDQITNLCSVLNKPE